MNTSCGIIVIDNFYNNVDDVRKFALTENYGVIGNYPGKRTKSYASEELKKVIQNYVRPFSGEITLFSIGDDKSNGENYNGAFQYVTSRDRS